MKKTLFLFAVMAMVCSTVLADVKLPKTFSDNAVLQQNKVVNVFGWAEPGEKVTVDFNGQKVETTACEAGKWLVQLQPMKTLNEGKDLIVSGKNSITLKNVVVGEVWVCSGQSNMEFVLRSQVGPAEEQTGDFSFVRYLRDPHVTNAQPQEDLAAGQWTECKGGQQGNITAVGFHFAVRLHQELNCPVGIIDCNWGGSRIESWMPEETKDQLPADTLKTISQNMGAKGNFAGMYNAKLAPWTKYTIDGALWYQGCSNGGEGDTYFEKQKAMIQAWRKAWGYDFPFYWVQLANFTAPSDNPNDRTGWAPLRDAQTKCLEVPQTGQAVIIDIGMEKDIHPKNKFTVGNRLAAWALVKDFGKQIVYASPLVKSAKCENGKITVTFDNVGGGLVAGNQDDRVFSVVDQPLKRFAVAGADKKFVWATAKITGKDTVEITCDEITEPKFVRYAWQQNPSGCNLYNAEGFPATPFSVEL